MFPLFFGYLTNFSVKGKSVPLQAWSGPESSRKLRFPDFVTTAQGGGKVVSLFFSFFTQLIRNLEKVKTKVDRFPTSMQFLF